MINRYEYDSTYTCKRSAPMERTAMILGLVSIFTSFILYISLPCGGLAIIIAFLSKGGTNSMSRRATRAAVLGAVGIACTAAIYIWSFTTLLQTYGSVEAILQTIYEQYGISY